MKVKDLRNILDNFEDNEEIKFAICMETGKRENVYLGAAEPSEKWALYRVLGGSKKMKMDINYGDLAKYLRFVKNKLFNISDMMSRDDFMRDSDIFHNYLEDFIENRYNGMNLEVICQVLENIDAAKRENKPFEY